VSQDRDRDLELDRIRQAYAGYATTDRAHLWDPRNQGYARMSADREATLTDLIRSSSPTRAAVLDVGCGGGKLAAAARTIDADIQWTGVDLLPEALATAEADHPWARFLEAAADSLPFADQTFDVAVAATLFSSLPSPEMELDVASEIRRVLRPGGWLIWYDLRYGNPANRSVHGLGRARLQTLFPGWNRQLRSMTLLPPIARRLSRATPVLYPMLEAVPPLRSHLIGRLRRPS
jgi:SAM-dependent methyltransferase